MATAQDVSNELNGGGNVGDEVIIGEGTPWQWATKRVRVAVFTIAWEITRGLKGLDTGRVADPDGKANRYSPIDALRRAAFELTLWLPRRGAKQLVAKQGGKETALGHAIDAASFGAINHALLVEVARKQGVDVDKVLAQFEEK